MVQVGKEETQVQRYPKATMLRGLCACRADPQTPAYYTGVNAEVSRGKEAPGISDGTRTRTGPPAVLDNRSQGQRP